MPSFIVRILCCAVCLLASLIAQTPRYIRYSDIADVIAAFQSSNEPVPDIHDSGAWDRWVRQLDNEVRARVSKGTEDSISNLILFGTSFTSLPRLNSVEEAVDSSDRLTPSARARIDAFAAALQNPSTERIRFASNFLKHNGAPQSIETKLRERLRLFAIEQRGY